MMDKGTEWGGRRGSIDVNWATRVDRTELIDFKMMNVNQ